MAKAVAPPRTKASAAETEELGPIFKAHPYVELAALLYRRDPDAYVRDTPGLRRVAQLQGDVLRGFPPALAGALLASAEYHQAGAQRHLEAARAVCEYPPTEKERLVPTRADVRTKEKRASDGRAEIADLQIQFAQDDPLMRQINRMRAESLITTLCQAPDNLATIHELVDAAGFRSDGLLVSTWLEVAVGAGALDTARWLLVWAPRLGRQRLPDIALHMAASGGHMATMRWVCDGDIFASPAAYNDNDCALIEEACAGGHLPMVEYLLGRFPYTVEKLGLWDDLDPDASHPNRALGYAVDRGHAAVAARLWRIGAP
jgi:hypothetical protein